MAKHIWFIVMFSRSNVSMASCVIRQVGISVIYKEPECNCRSVKCSPRNVTVGKQLISLCKEIPKTHTGFRRSEQNILSRQMLWMLFATMSMKLYMFWPDTGWYSGSTPPAGCIQTSCKSSPWSGSACLRSRLNRAHRWGSSRAAG